MERAQVLVIAVVVAALVLFGLRFFSSDPIESDLTLSDERIGDVANAPRFGSGASGGRSESGGTMGGSRSQPGRLRDSHSADSSSGGSGGFERRGADSRSGGSGAGSGSARVLTGGALRGGGGSVGASGSSAGSRGGGGSGGTVTLGSEPSGRLAPKAALKEDLVDSLAARPEVQNQAAPPADGDAALQVSKPEDIPEQEGQAEEVQEADDGDGIKITDRGRVEFPNAGNASASGTISFQIKPEWNGADQGDNAIVQIRQEHQWQNRLELVKNGEFLRFIVTPDSGVEADISSRITGWNANEVHDIQVTWDNDSKTTRLWIDGQVAGSNTYTGQLNFSPGTPMFLGADHRGSNYSGANATLYDFTLSNSATQP
jgi:hypothetical protein